MKRVCIYCGSNFGIRHAYVEVAHDLGSILARRGIGVVYGGGHRGLMGAVADAVLAENGDVIGVATTSFIASGRSHNGLTDLRVVRSVHEQKALMAELVDAFIALPGGFGTFGGVL